MTKPNEIPDNGPAHEGLANKPIERNVIVEATRLGHRIARRLLGADSLDDRAWVFFMRQVQSGGNKAVVRQQGEPLHPRRRSDVRTLAWMKRRKSCRKSSI